MASSYGNAIALANAKQFAREERVVGEGIDKRLCYSERLLIHLVIRACK